LWTRAFVVIVHDSNLGSNAPACFIAIVLTR